jgi:hypothetical protein
MLIISIIGLRFVNSIVGLFIIYAIRGYQLNNDWIHQCHFFKIKDYGYGGE